MKPYEQLEAVWRTKTGDFVVVDMPEIDFRATDMRPFGAKLWFEYHCNESHDSPDAPLWYHSHQIVEIIGLADHDLTEGYTFEERAYNGESIMYRVRFADGFEWTVFEDELLDSESEFCCKTPPL